jgi:hypothetical protein
MGERPPSFVTKWGQNGEGDGEFVLPQGVALDSSDNVYIGEGGNHRIQKFTSEGTFITKWGSEGRGDGQFIADPRGVAVDSSNNVYVSEQGNNRIQKFESPLSGEGAMFTFAQTSTFQSDQKFEPRPTHAVPQLDVSDDGRALTLTFSAFELTIGASKSPAPTSTHVFSFVLPLEGEDNESVEIDFHIQGFVLTTEGATATVVLSVNGQTTFADFPANSEESYLQSLKYTAPSPPSECRLSVFLLVGRDSTNSDAEAFINTLAIDANIPSAPEGT